jgi:hypothetical protein
MNRRVDQALDIECVPTTLIVSFFVSFFFKLRDFQIGFIVFGWVKI